MKISKSIIWIIVITIFGILIQSAETLGTGKPFDMGAVIVVWFFMFGCIPGGIFWLITRRQESSVVKKKLLSKKVIGGIAATLIISFIIINGLTYMTSGFFFWEIMATHSLPMNVVNEKAGTFIRNYPETVKGNWEPNALHMERMMVLDLERIRELGVNTVSIAAEYEFANDGTYFIRDEEKIMSNLVRAKENGFAVWLGVSFVGVGYGHSLKEKGITLERYLNVSEQVALKWAKIAEDYSVELFCPQAELDHILRIYYFSGYNVQEAEVAQTTAYWYKSILPEVKEMYKGKTVAKFAAVSREWRNATFEGYDYVGSGMTHNIMDPEEYREYARERYSILAEMAENSGAKWGVFEAWFTFGGPFFPTTTTTHSGQPLEPLQDDYYTISFEEYQNFTGNIKPSVFIFHSWTMLSSPVRGRPAEQVLKENFGKI
jgi:hypothetical protein